MDDYQGEIRMTRISNAARVGECWLCSYRWFWCWLLQVVRLRLKHEHEPILELTFKEIQRLDKKHRRDRDQG